MVIRQEAFNSLTAAQKILIKGRSKAPDGWDSDWNKECNAQIIWNEYQYKAA